MISAATKNFSEYSKAEVEDYVQRAFPGSVLVGEKAVDKNNITKQGCVYSYRAVGGFEFCEAEGLIRTTYRSSYVAL